MTSFNAADMKEGSLATDSAVSARHSSIDLLIGPYRSGKTAYLLEKILSIHQAEPFSETFMIVPSKRYQQVLEERLSHALNQRSESSASGRGIVGLKIMNFYSLVQTLCRRAGKTFRIVPEQIRPSIVGRVIARLRDQGELKDLSKISSFVGIHQNILALIDEFERAALSPDEVLSQVQSSAHSNSRYVELAKIYKLYWQELEELDLIDERQLAFTLRDLLNSSACGPSLENVFIDGFDRFNKLQLQVFAELSRNVRKMTISFDYAESTGRIHPDYVWKESSYKALQVQLGAMLNTNWFGSSIANPAIATTISNAKNSNRSQSSISKFTVNDRFLEMEEVARRVKNAIVIDKVSPENILVVVRTLKGYANPIKTAFDDAAIPYFLDQSIELFRLPVIQQIRRLLGLYEGGLLRREVIECLRSAYLSANVGLQPWQIDEIDKRSMRQRIVGGLEQWKEISRPRGDFRTNLASDTIEPAREGVDFFPTLHSQLSIFFDSLKPLALACLSEHVKWAENLLERNFESVFERRTNSRNFKDRSRGRQSSDQDLEDDWYENHKDFQKWLEQKAIGEFRRCLSAMLLEEAYLGDQKISTSEFLVRLDRSLSKANFRPVPTVKNCVTVCGADLAPNRSFDEVYIAGLAEGEFPRKTAAFGFVGADQIAQWSSFGIDISNPRYHPGFESALFVNLVGRGLKNVHLSYPSRDLSGDELLPSIFLEEGLQGTEIEEYSIFSRASILPSSARNLFAGAISALGPAASLDLRFRKIEEFWSSRYGEAAQLLVENLSESIALAYGRLASDRRNVYNGYLNDFICAGTLKVPVPERWSATKLSEYGKCGFRYWVSHVLDTEPVEEPQSGLDNKLLGETYHKAMELFYKELSEQNRLVTDDAESVKSAFDDAIEKSLTWLQESEKFRAGEFWRFEMLEIRFRLRRFLANEIRRAEKDKFQFVPTLFEVSFGSDKSGFKPLIVKNGETEILIGGRIDRIDISQNAGSIPLVRLVDYKKGSMPIKSAEAYSGRNLQLALYALAVEQSILPARQVVEGVYLSISSGAPSGKLRFGSWENSQLNDTKLTERTLAYVRDFVNRIKSGEFLVQPNGLDLCKRCRHKSVCRISELDVASGSEE